MKSGRKVAELAGKHLKKVTLELGGKNSILILDDADLDLAESNVAWGAWLHQGQICMSAGRVLVHEKLVNELVERDRRLWQWDPARRSFELGRVHRVALDDDPRQTSPVSLLGRLCSS